jgi:hypothetical protein
MRMLSLVVALVLTVVTAWCCITLRIGSSGVPLVRGPDATADAIRGLDALQTEDAGAARAAVREAPIETVQVEMDDADLLELLRAAGSAWKAGDIQSSASPLEALLSSPRTPRRVLAMLEEARLGAGSLEEQGAILAIGFGLAHANRTGALSLDGRPLARDVLEALTRIEREPGVGVAQFASSLRIGNELAVDARWVATIVSLRSRVPAHAENFEPFLRAILDRTSPIDMPEDDMAALAQVVASSNDALAVEVALSALVARDPATFIPIAEDLYAHSAANAALRAAAVAAIAARAPVDAAAESLARMADSDLYGQFMRLGEREGGIEAAQDKYSALIAANTSPQARKMLVSAMGTEQTEVLVGIAQTDPAAAVRHQALLTASLQPLESDTVMRTLRDQLAAHDGAGNGISTHDGLMVAQNVLLNGAGSARSDAVALLRQVVIDPRASMADRKDAWNQLRENGSPSDIAGIDEPH